MESKSRLTFSVICLSSVLLSSPLAAPAATNPKPYTGKGISPAYLRCEYLVDPLGIGESAPRLSWIVESGERGQRQTAYRLLVASSEKLPPPGPGRSLGHRQGRQRRDHLRGLSGSATRLTSTLLLEGEGLGQGRPRIGLEQAGDVVHGPAAARRLEGRLDRLRQTPQGGRAAGSARSGQVDLARRRRARKRAQVPAPFLLRLHPAGGRAR